MSIVFLLTLLGMGFVFAALILLWAVMEGVVRLLPEAVVERAAAEKSEASEAERILRAHVAVAAVAMALALEAETTNTAPPPIPPPPPPPGWARQGGVRSSQLKQRGPVR
jgi:Na+-transporting methylmalonyl-CoA/oxaloacetate decarboxylase gamma subunit